MLLMQTNTAPYLGPAAEAAKHGGYELTVEKIKTEKSQHDELKRDFMGFDKFNWGANFNYKELNQLLSRPQQEMVARRPMEELEMEMELLRSRQAKRFEAERRREQHARRNAAEKPPLPQQSDMNGKLPPEYMLPMSPPGIKQLPRNLGPLNWASVASWFFRPEGGSVTTTSANTTPSRNPGEPHFAVAPTICTMFPDLGFSTNAIRCTVPGCTCECFTPGKLHIRYCETCSHGWVPHALDKLGFRHVYGQSPVEPVQPNVAFDIASLVLYGCQALPIRLKILLDRLFSVLQRDEVLQVLRGFGWTHEDYARGYILQEPHGAVLDRWNICSPEEEPLVLQQFLRFGETRAITQQLLLHSAGDARGLPRLEADLQKFIERAAGRLPSKEEDRNSRISIKPIQQLQQQHQPRRGLSPPPSAPQNHLPPSMGGQHHLGPARPPIPPPPISPQKNPAMNFLKLPPTGLTCTPATTSNGPVTSSPPSSISSSPISVSPLNRLQSMQPFDFRKIATGASAPVKASPERRRSETSEASPPGLMNLCVTSPNPVCPPPPPPVPATSTGMPVYPGHRSPSGDPTGSSEFGSDDDDDDEENSHSALNLSRDAAPKLGRPPKPQHLRKTSTPMKRQWGANALPLNLGTQLINPATGKKRVQCNVCLKTFCDKGALKIHFSAVHLREMHKCTVEGCNMMFSSRRSRNRHSANPNPKLHSPHLRRKISPHDGRSAQPHHILIPPIPPTSLGHLPFGTFPLLPTPDMRHQQAVMDLKQSLDLSLHRQEEQRRYANSSSDHMDDYMMDDDDEEGIVVVGNGDDDYELDNETQNGDKSESDRSKRLKFSESDMDEDVGSNMDSNEDSLSVVDSQSTKEENIGESATTSSKRKRKNQNPTRCAVAQRVVDEDGMMTDEDSSNDVFHGKAENLTSPSKELHDQPKNWDADAQVQDLSGKKSPEQNPNNDVPENLSTNHASPTNLQKMDVETKNEDEDSKNDNSKNENISESDKNVYKNVQDTSETDERLNNENNNIPIQNLKHEKTEDIINSKSPKTNKTEDQIDSSNALRQLENLSQGNFGEISMNRANESYPLNFMMNHDPPSPARSHSSSVSSGGSQDDDTSDQIYGHFQDGTFISTMDVPIDKDNPRMCTACGKMFQNHFGVKTHYQNVHLKLMHKCTVDGCNAAFPSKRSRDRHSANLNLHRKLLSTSLTDKTGSLFLENSPFSSIAANTALHNELLSRFYGDPQALPMGHLPPPGLLNGDRLPPHPPMFLPPLGGLPGFPGMNNFPHLTQPLQNMNGHSSGSASPASPASSPTPAQGDDDLPTPDRDGMLPCRFCHQPQQDASALKDHYEQHHSSEMFRCTIPSCGQLFSSRSLRDSHSENDALHQPSPPITSS